MEEALVTVSAFEHTHDNQSFHHLKYKKCKNKDKTFPKEYQVMIVIWLEGKKNHKISHKI